MDKTEKGYSREDWQKHYDSEDMPWDLDAPSPPLIRMWAERKLGEGGRMLIPGCGRGHEAVYFAERGFDVTAVDYAPGAVSRLSDALGKRRLKARVLLQDFFELDSSRENGYDWMLEQTFFCAIHPSRRGDYAKLASALLKPGGMLAALFYETGESGGPPFNTTEQDVREHFTSRFDIELLEKTAHSVERRNGKEWLALLRRKKQS